jgi:hypothetical protein
VVRPAPGRPRLRPSGAAAPQPAHRSGPPSGRLGEELPGLRSPEHPAARIGLRQRPRSPRCGTPACAVLHLPSPHCSRDAHRPGWDRAALRRRRLVSGRPSSSAQPPEQRPAPGPSGAGARRLTAVGAAVGGRHHAAGTAGSGGRRGQWCVGVLLCLRSAARRLHLRGRRGLMRLVGDFWSELEEPASSWGCRPA